ncbi:uncharacterized protein LOC142161897 [Nicotiana tabacum]|uniref:Uncharacterized protein LOC142161897 n=1 Tax=Nicotiana tabacum TaxID=4097 RepID=A0AC58RMR3_TOBAC
MEASTMVASRMGWWLQQWWASKIGSWQQLNLSDDSLPDWRRSILIALSVKNKLGFIDGICVEPKLDSADYPLWSRANDMVTSWLLNSLSKDIVQRNNSVSSYFTTLKKLWDEMDSLRSHLNYSSDCVYGGKAKVAKFLEDQRIIQFIMGLNDVYAQARGNILMMSPLPSMDFAYSLLLQNENQRGFCESGAQGKVALRYNQGQMVWNPSSKSRNNQQQKTKAKKAKYNPNHAVKGNTAMGGHDNETNPNPNNEGVVGSQNQSFSKEQISVLVNIIRQVQGGNAGNTGSEINANAVTGASEHMYFDSSFFLELSHLHIPVHIILPNSFQVPLVRRGQAFGEIREGLGTWTFLLSLKANAFTILKSFFVMTERQFNITVKKVRSDNALELGRGSQQSDFLLSQGILLETSCVGIPQQNNIVERKHRHLLEFSSRVLKRKTPYHILFRKPPVYDNLKIFGYLCYASTLAHNRSKFDPRARAYVFLRYSLHQKGYKLLDLKIETVFMSRDVKFYENYFPFVTIPTPQTHQLFPPTLPIPDTTLPDSMFLSPSSPLSSTSPFPSPSNTASPSTSPITLPSPRSFNFSSPSPTHNLSSSPLPNDLSSRQPSTAHNLSSPTSAPSTSITLPIPPPPIRKSERISQQPRYLKDYVCNVIFLSDITSSCFNHASHPTTLFFIALSLNNQNILRSVSSISEPHNYTQASQDAGWRKAMEAELAALDLNNTWDVVDLP